MEKNLAEKNNLIIKYLKNRIFFLVKTSRNKKLICYSNMLAFAKIHKVKTHYHNHKIVPIETTFTKSNMEISNAKHICNVLI